MSSLPAPAVVGATPAGADLLPSTPSNISIDDALTALMKLSSAINEQQTKTAKGEADCAAALRKGASEKRTAAINDAIEAARKAEEEREEGGLFDFVTDNLGPVGLVAMVVGSVYIAAADVGAHAVGLDDDKLDLADTAGLGAMLAGPLGVAAYAAQLCVKKFGPDELQQALDEGPTVADDDVRTANKMAFAVTQAQVALAATVASGGTTAPAIVAIVGIAISTATELAQESGALTATFGDDARWVALGGTLTGAALSLGGGAVLAFSNPPAAARIGEMAVEVQTILQGAHDINQGLHNLRAADYQHDADNFRVDAQHQKNVVELVERMIDAVIEDMKNIKESAQKTTELIQSTMQTQNQTLLLAGNMKA
jgi:hypothetical protein